MRNYDECFTAIHKEIPTII